MKEECEKVGLNLNIQKTKIMASSPVNSWQIDGETVETVADCHSHMLTPWKESYEQPRQHTKKQRHYFDNKGLSSKSYHFSSLMYGCENWTIKKA